MDNTLITDPTLAAFHEPRKPEEDRQMVYYTARVDPETGDLQMHIKHQPALFIEFDYCTSDNEGRANALQDRKTR